MSGGEIIYRDLSFQIMNAIFEVHNTLGPGFIESIYEEALRQIPFERQKVLSTDWIWNGPNKIS